MFKTGNLLFSISFFLLSIFNYTNLAQSSKTVRYTEDDLFISKENGFDKVHLRGADFHKEKIGAPDLPCNIYNFTVPSNMTFDQVTILQKNSKQILGKFYIMPVQPEIKVDTPPDSIVEFVDPDAKIYNLTSYPENMIEFLGDGYSFGYHIISLKFNPILYNPKTGELSLLTEVNFSFSLRNTEDKAFKFKRRSKESQQIVNTFIKSLVDNPEELDKNGLQKNLLIKTSIPTSVLDIKEFPHIDGNPVDYLIITSDEFQNAFQPLADWKIKKGIVTTIRTTSWIHNNYPGSDLQEQIRNFIKDAVDKWGLIWILLGGDTDIIPVRYIYASKHPTDLYYSSLEGTWNSNGDAVFGDFGGGADFLPDVFIGRAPINTIEDVNTFINKINIYEKNPPMTNYLDRILMLGASLLPGGTDGMGCKDKEGLQTQTWYPSCFLHNHEYELYAPISGSGWNGDNELNLINTTTQLNTGYHFVNHMDHSNPYTMGTGALSGGGYIHNPDAEGLNNGPRFSIVWTYGCLPNAFDFASISEAFMNNPDGGAICFIGNTRDGWSDQEDQDYRFFRSLFYSKLYHIGQAFASTQNPSLFGNYDTYNTNLLGDPELPVWTSTPQTLIVSHLTSAHIGENNFTVTISNLPVGQEAIVCLKKGNEDYAFGETIGGHITFSFTPDTPGELLVTITSQNFLPYEVTIPVTQTSSHLYVESYIIDDDQSDESSGNADGHVDDGETIELPVTLRNSGSSSLTNIVATLATFERGTSNPSPYVTITDGTENFGNVPSNSSVTCADDFGFTVSFCPDPLLDCPEEEIVEFRLNITDGGAFNETDVFYLQIGTSEIQHTKNTINGDLEPNATVGITIEISNYGASVASGITATLSSSSSYITSITGNPQSYFDIDPNNSVSAPFGFTLNSNYIVNHEEDLDFTLTIHDSYGKEWTHNFDLKKPGVPINIICTGNETSIELRWGKPSDTDLLGYNVYRENVGGTFEKVNNSLIEATFFNDINLDRETIYNYKVSAVDNSSNESDLTTSIESWTSLSYLSGWPIESPNGNFIFSSPTLADINNDGDMEIFFADGGGTIYAFDQIGQEVKELFDRDHNPTSWSGFAHQDNTEFWSTPAISDLDGDGIYELIIAGRASNHTLYCWHINDSDLDGSPDLYWEVDLGDACLGSPAIGDIDHNGRKEIVIMSHNGYVHIRRDDGTNYLYPDPWKMIGNISLESYCTPALADLDHDGDLEIIIGGSDGKMHVWYYDGVDYPGWPFDTGMNNLGSSPAVADIDNDGQFEIIFIAANGTGTSPKVFVKEANGSDKSNWSGGKSINNLGHVVSTSPAIGNLDEDAQLEIVVGTGSTVYAWDYNGSNLTGWPKTVTGFSGTSSSPMIADVDEIPGPEIIIGSNDHKLYAWHTDGTNVKGWPIITNNIILASPAIGDVDGDGDYETVACSYDKFFHIWNTKGTSNQDWAMFHNDAENTGSNYQQYLLNNALQNKSLYYAATCYDNNRVIERGYYGKLHFVFSSGGEIFYRRSSNNGTNWELTQRISTGNGSNSCPSIVAAQYSGSDILCLVWQYKINSRHYKIFYSFSSNSGTTWSAPTTVPGCSDVNISYYQSNDYYGPGSTPVVASFLGLSGDQPDFLLVYAAIDGLHYRYTPNYSSAWVIPGSDIIPGTESDHVWFPSLSTYNSRDFYQNYHQLNLIYDIRMSNVYSQIFKHPGLQWTNRVQVSTSGSNYHFGNTMAIDNAYWSYAVWGELYGSYYSIRYRVAFSPGSWSTWNEQWIISNAHCYFPVITYYNDLGLPSLDILFHTSTNQIRQKIFDAQADNWSPINPNTRILAYSGMFPNLTHERSNTPVPIQFWTDQSISPHSMLYNSDYLSKESSKIVCGEMRRAVEIVDTSINSGIRLEFSQPVVKLKDGDKILVPFKKYNYKEEFSLSLSNVFDYLQTEVITMPEDVESISCKIIVKSLQLDTLDNGSINPNKRTNFKDINFDFFVEDMNSKNILFNLASQKLNSDKGLHDFEKLFEASTNILNEKNIFFIPKINISGAFKESDLLYSIINVSIEDSSSLLIDSTLIVNKNTPNEYNILGNYPNPFNPSTTINYSLPFESTVELKIYDIIGREIRSFSIPNQSAGYHGIFWDGKNNFGEEVSSGVYLYRIKMKSLRDSKDFIKTAKLLMIK